MAIKLAEICALIEEMNLTPKVFITAFLTHSAENLAFRRRFWATKTRWDSTESLFEALRHLMSSCTEGRDHWHQWILQQVSHLERSFTQ
jgi:hypothetical protein